MSWSAERRGRAGFVLLEAVIALAILSIVIVSLLAAAGGQLRTAGDATARVTAQALAEDRLTAFRLLDYEGLRAPPDSLRAGAFPAPFREWSWETTVREEIYDLFRVDVVIRGPGTEFPIETSIHRARPIIGTNGGDE